ncbi:MAG: aminotransferase class I/II-fold pyridoxal phosphate-dependent enzyme [Halobacteriovoraceae bacterium]|jgi:threonine aldolase|nr:aminotransferase class I/II-fold pyridoxal phosphate-dependent enzyme [Halobacteriovoraceae bacterium]
MEKIIDLRSDTVTTPTPKMLKCMMEAEVGDDVFGTDPSVNKLEEMAAGLFDKEAALFCPSGTMTNQIAVFLQAPPLSEIIIEESNHIYQYEVGGVAFNSRASVKTVNGDQGKLTQDQIMNAINPDDIHKPKTTLVCLENTTNRGGGATYSLEELEAISEICKRENLKLHLDGARLFNALAETAIPTAKIGGLFDTISICLSKGLGAPVGSLLLGDEGTIRKARQVRKVMGGGMRQAGFLAAAGIYALEHNRERLADDHLLAESLRELLKQQSYIKEVFNGQTNIVLFDLSKNYSPKNFLNFLNQHGILAVQFGPQRIRFVTHLGLDSSVLEPLAQVLPLFTSL